MHRLLSIDLSELAGSEICSGFRCGECLTRSDELAIFSGIHGDTGEPITLEVVRRKAERVLLDGPRDQALRRIGHPKIATPLESGESDAGLAFRAMERLPGEPLLARILDHRLTPAEAVPIVAALAEILSLIHAAGAVYGNLHPARVLVSGSTDHPDVRLAFGIICPTAIELESDSWSRAIVEERPSLPWANIAPTVFTPVAYAGPEEFIGAQPDAISEVYGLGAMLYEMLAGSPPYRAHSPARLAAAHFSMAPPRLGKLVPWRLDAEIMRALSRPRNERHQSAAELGESLRRALASDSSSNLVAARGSHESGVHTRETAEISREALDEVIRAAGLPSTPNTESWEEEIPTLRFGGVRITRSRSSDAAGTLWDTVDGRVLVQLGTDLTVNHDAVATFMRDAEILRDVSHAHLCRITQAVNEGKTAYLLIEIPPGQSLRQKLRAERPTRDEIIRIGADVARALSAVHATGRRIGDLTPDSIVLDERGPAMVLPTCMGAFVMQSETRRPYAAPELARRREPDARADVYALGAILREAFGDEGAPPRVAQVLSRALEPLAGARPKIEEFLRALSNANDESQAPSPEPAVERLARARRIVGAIVLGAIVLLALALWRAS